MMSDMQKLQITGNILVCSSTILNVLFLSSLFFLPCF
jgi:hypothetical protein